MEVPFKRLFSRPKTVVETDTPTKNKAFIKTDKKFFFLIGIVFTIAASAIFYYWFFIEKPSLVKTISDKDELIKELKFARDKLNKIHENTVAFYEQKTKNELVPKSTYDEKINEFKIKLDSYANNYILKDENEKQIRDLMRRFENVAKDTYRQKITNLEYNLSVVEGKNLKQKTEFEAAKKFIEAEKDYLEDMILLERKKMSIPSLIFPETINNTLNVKTLKNLVAIKNKLEDIEDMNITLKASTYFEMGLISYYNKQHEKAIEQWETAISLNKNDIKAYICLGVLYSLEKMHDNAVKILTRAIELNPNRTTPHLALAQIYEGKNMLDDAIYEYSKMLEISPESIELHNTLGTLYEKNGMKEESKKAFAQYEKLKKGHK